MHDTHLTYAPVTKIDALAAVVVVVAAARSAVVVPASAPAFLSSPASDRLG